MKFITFSDRDGKYCYNANSIQRISWEETSVIYIYFSDKSLAHFFKDTDSANIIYHDILRQLCERN